MHVLACFTPGVHELLAHTLLHIYTYLYHYTWTMHPCVSLLDSTMRLLCDMRSSSSWKLNASQECWWV